MEAPRADGEREVWGRALFVLALAAIFVTNIDPLGDFDIFYHLAIGDWILGHRSVPRTGLFSATMGSRPWVDNEWGFQVLVAACHRVLGVLGLVVLKAALVTLAAAILGLGLRRRGVAWIAVALGLGFLSFVLGSPILRPQLVSYVFLALFLGATADLIEARSGRGLIVLPLTAALWANCHAGFILAPVVLGVPFGTELLRRILRRPPALPLGRLAATWWLTSAACFVNPYGWKQVYYPIHYALEPGMTAFNLEWQPVVLAQRPALQALLGAVVALMALAPRRPATYDVVWLLAFGGFALGAYRHTGLLAFVATFSAALPAAAAAEQLLVVARRQRWLLYPAVALLAVGCVLAGAGWPRGSPFRLDERILLPTGATDFLLRHRPPGRLFNQYGDGGYLIYRFAPESVVFVDGRNDLYGEAFMREYFTVMEGGPAALAILNRHGIDTALLVEHENNAALLRTLHEDGWVVIHRSEDGFLPFLVLVRDVPEARERIERLQRPPSPPR